MNENPIHVEAFYDRWRVMLRGNIPLAIYDAVEHAESHARRIREALAWEPPVAEPITCHCCGEPPCLRAHDLRPSAVFACGCPDLLQLRVRRVEAPKLVIDDDDDAPDMSAERRQWLEAEVATCRAFLAQEPADAVVDRIQWRDRLEAAEAELKRQEAEWMYEDLKAMGR